MELKKIFCTKCAAFQTLLITYREKDSKTNLTLIKLTCVVCASRIMQLMVSDDAPAPALAPVPVHASPPVPSPLPSPSPEAVSELAPAQENNSISRFSKEHQAALKDPRKMWNIQNRKV